jgi:hypothetical protein
MPVAPPGWSQGQSLKDEELLHVTTHRKPRSLLRRLIYFVLMLATGGGAGAGGWALKDHPRAQALLSMVLGKTAEVESEDGAGLKDTLVSTVSAALKRENVRQPGLFRVKIEEVELDPRLFSKGRTVDIQARVRKVDGDGRETILWESKHYGENLAVAGKDDLTATWLNRPFEIAWTPGDQVIVEVWDRRGGLLEPREFRMALPEPGGFPLSSGAHALEISRPRQSRRDSDRNSIVLQSERVRDSTRPSAHEVAERPIVIK